jgi:Ca2+-binding RTX toxin-like protein
MYHDILAIQSLYGVKTFQTGNNVYTFNQGTTYFQTIYDSGGTDGIIFNGTRACVINLNNGAFSSLSDSIFFNNGVSSNATVCIGPNPVIENATGGSGDDLIVGNAANNQLIGGLGTDTMLGGFGNDIYSVDNINESLTENANGGTDTVRTSVTWTRGANFEHLVLLGSAISNGVGNTLANSIAGNAAVNFLNGGGGADQINGGARNDVLYGGQGADRFVFSTALASNVDRIDDFNVADDAVVLANAVFTGLAAGVLAADAFRIGGAAADAKDRIIYNSSTGALLFDANGSAAGEAVQFATLSAGLALTNNDFLIV